MLAGQGFWHTTQCEGKLVADFVRCLKRTFHVTYGHDKMSNEMKEAILFGQLQEGLRLELLRGPAVLGALGYMELWVATKGEERCLSELKKCRAYLQQGNLQPGNVPKPSAK